MGSVFLVVTFLVVSWSMAFAGRSFDDQARTLDIGWGPTANTETGGVTMGLMVVLEMLIAR